MANKLRDVRPLDYLGSIKMKLGVLVAASVTVAVFVTWLGLQRQIGPTRTLPIAIGIGLLLTLVLARGMTSPLREMTATTKQMAEGNYDIRVRATSRDEVGQLATAFNTMANELASSDRMRRDLIANVSHELRTPVTALQAQLENIVDGVVAPSPKVFETALSQTERLSRLITYLLDLSRLEAGAADLTLVRLSAQNFVQDVIDSVSLIAIEKHLEYTLVVQPPDLKVFMDSERMRQVLINLLQNAIRHSPENGEVKVSVLDTETEVLIEVSDQGPGISKSDREHIFERFARGEGAKSVTGGSHTGGTGLGLAIVRWAVNLHGGSVEVADVAKGTTMRIVLPKFPSDLSRNWKYSTNDGTLA